MADEVNEGGSGMTLEDAVKAFEQILPLFEMYKASLNPAVVEAEADLVPLDEAESVELAVAPEDVVGIAADADTGKKDDKSDDKKTVAAKDADDKSKADKKDEPKKESAMDSATQFKAFASQLRKRDALAGELSKHVGTFDTADMTDAEVAVYGAKKLGLKVQAGQELTAVQAYMQGRGDPTKAVLVRGSTGMDAAPKKTFVDRYINKGE